MFFKLAFLYSLMVMFWVCFDVNQRSNYLIWSYKLLCESQITVSSIITSLSSYSSHFTYSASYRKLYWNRTICKKPNLFGLWLTYDILLLNVILIFTYLVLFPLRSVCIFWWRKKNWERCVAVQIIAVSHPEGLTKLTSYILPQECRNLRQTHTQPLDWSWGFLKLN